MPLIPDCSHSNALVRLKIDGSILLAVASVEIGQGVQATMANIAAQVLNQPIESVTVLATDTATAPFDWGTGASRSTVIVGLSVEAAANDAAQQMIEMAADILDIEANVEPRFGRCIRRSLHLFL